MNMVIVEILGSILLYLISGYNLYYFIIGETNRIPHDILFKKIAFAEITIHISS